MLNEIFNAILNRLQDELSDLFDEEEIEEVEINNIEILDLFTDFLLALQEARTKHLVHLKSINESNTDFKSNFSRKERRMIAKEAGIDKKLNAEINKIEKKLIELDLVNRITCGIDPATTDEEYEIFIKYLWNFILSTEEMKQDKEYATDRIQNITISDVEELLKYIITNSKANNANCKFLSCFDEDGNLLREKMIELNNLLNVFFSSYESMENIPNNLTKEKYTSLIINQEELKEEQDKARLLAQQKKEQEELLKKQEREKQKQLEAERISNATPYTTSTLKSEYVRKKVEDYFDLRARDLKSNVIDLISWEDLKPLLLELPDMTKSELYKLKERYNHLYMVDKLARINRSLSKNNVTKFNELFQSNIDIQEEIKELIFSDEFKTMKKSQIVTAVMNIINIEQRDTMTNFIILSNPNLLHESTEIVDKAPVENTDSLNRNIFHQLYLLQTQTLNELQKGGSATFHPLKYGAAQGGDFTLENGMKAYRFGKRKSKVCYFKASVCSENQEMLKSYYNIDKTNDLLIVFGLGNVWAEQEIDLYNRCIENANTDYEYIEMIRKVLSVPFTDDSFKFITNLIDSANQQLSDYRTKYNNLENTLN